MKVEFNHQLESLYIRHQAIFLFLKTKNANSFKFPQRFVKVPLIPSADLAQFIDGSRLFFVDHTQQGPVSFGKNMVNTVQRFAFNFVACLFHLTRLFICSNRKKNDEKISHFLSVCHDDLFSHSAAAQPQQNRCYCQRTAYRSSTESCDTPSSEFISYRPGRMQACRPASLSDSIVSGRKPEQLLTIRKRIR